MSQDLRFLSDFAIAQRDFERRRLAGKGNVFYRLEEHANNSKRSNEVFLIFEGKSWTFKQYYDTVLRYAGWLSGTHKVVAGEIVALDFLNCPAFLFLTLAIWSLGASPAFINHNLTSRPLIHSVRVSTARLLIVDPELELKVLTDETKESFGASNFRNNAFPLETIVLDEGLQKSLNYFPPYRAPDAARSIDKPSSIAALMYTSGTTGLPKAAIVPWGRMGIGGDLCSRLLGMRSVDKRNPDRFYTGYVIKSPSIECFNAHNLVPQDATVPHNCLHTWLQSLSAIGHDSSHEQEILRLEVLGRSQDVAGHDNPIRG